MTGLSWLLITIGCVGARVSQPRLWTDKRIVIKRKRNKRKQKRGIQLKAAKRPKVKRKYSMRVPVVRQRP